MKPEIQDRIEAIKSFWQSGMTSGAIAKGLAGLGHDVTRMSVIGMYNRYPDVLKDYPLPAPSLAKPGSRRERRAHQKRAYTKRVIKIPKPSNVLPFVIPDTAFTYVPTAPTKQLYQLEAHECRWPMNGVGADMQFCSQHAEGSYCPHHQRLSVGKGTASERGALRAARRMA